MFQNLIIRQACMGINCFGDQRAGRDELCCCLQLTKKQRRLSLDIPNTLVKNGKFGCMAFMPPDLNI